MIKSSAILMLIATAPAFAQVAPRSDAQQVGDAATQPLSDINLKKRTIPPLLATAQAAPYALRGLKGCGSLRTEIRKYDDVLGPDFDAQSGGSKPNAGVTAARLGGNVLAGFIPFRGIVRELTGANAEDRRYATALYAGVARRSFLKGVATARGCR